MAPHRGQSLEQFSDVLRYGKGLQQSETDIQPTKSEIFFISSYVDHEKRFQNHSLSSVRDDKVVRMIHTVDVRNKGQDDL